MLLAYVDESVNGHDHWIAAVVCPEDALVPLASALDDVVEKAAESFRGISSEAELHGYCLFHGKDDWEVLRPIPRARIGIYNEALEAIGTSGARIIIRGVDVERLNNRYKYPDHPHTVVLTHLLERIDELAESMDDLALVIADEVDKEDDHRRSLWRFQRYATGGYRSRRLTRIVDTLHFAPSNASRLVQAADMVAFIHSRIKSGRERDARALRANTALYGRIEGCIEESSGIWLP